MDIDRVITTRNELEAARRERDEMAAGPEEKRRTAYKANRDAIKELAQQLFERIGGANAHDLAMRLETIASSYRQIIDSYVHLVNVSAEADDAT